MSQPTVTLPTELTAENGAKALLMGDFKESIPVICPDCLGHDGDEICETCDGDGELYQDVPISWTTIKAIYAKIVENMAVKA